MVMSAAIFATAKKFSQVATHMGLAFAIMYLMTGSPAFGGLAAVLEPVINVALLPLHERVWQSCQQQMTATKSRYLALAAEKISQVGMHTAVAFSVMYFATGSAAISGMAAVLEPVCNVIALPFHDKMWERLEVQLTRNDRWAVA
jgi:uncharacterized membrane protein